LIQISRLRGRFEIGQGYAGKRVRRPGVIDGDGPILGDRNDVVLKDQFALLELSIAPGELLGHS